MHNSLRDNVLERVDLLEVIGERVALKRKGKEYVGLCPFHDDHKPSMGVNPAKGIFKCWSCGAGGDVIKFVQLYERVDFKEALRQLAQRAGLELRNTPEQKAEDSRREQLRKVLAWAAQHFQRNLAAGGAGRAAREYARGRGLSDASLDRFQVGLAADAWDDLLSAARQARVPLDLLNEAGLTSTSQAGKTFDRFRNRLMFPIRDALGRVVAFGGRTLGNDDAKYLNSPETALFSKSRILYGYDQARDAIRKRGRVIVTEGYLDTVLLQQHGVEHAVATLGTALTDAHVKLLKPLVEDILLCFDGDEAGQRAADRGIDTSLRQSVRTRVVLFPDGTDPADCVQQGGVAALDEMLARAQDALEFKWSQTLTALNGGALNSRRDAIETFLRSVASACVAGKLDPIELGLLTRRISDLLALPGDQVYRLLAQQRENLQRGPAHEPGSEAVESDVYRLALADVPPALIPATEEIFGLLLEEGRFFDRLDETFAEAVGYCELWQQLFDIMRDTADATGTVTFPEVMARLDDTGMLELVQRVRERVGEVADRDPFFDGAMRRLREELDAIRITDLRGRFTAHDPQPADVDSFAAFVAASRQRHGFAGLK